MGLANIILRWVWMANGEFLEKKIFGGGGGRFVFVIR